MHLAALIQDLAVILGVAAVVTFVFKLIKQPVVLGYIVAGVIVGPYTPPLFSVIDVESVKVWAELGVIFLMFALGLEFSFRRLARVGASAGATAGVQIVTMIALGYGAGRALGWKAMDAVFLGCMVSISSTTIIIKALEELRLKTRRFAELVFGILIVEDLAAIVMLVALANIATKASVSGLDLLAAGAKLAFVVGAWLVIGMFIVPRLVRAVARRGNDEMMIVVALGLCLALVSLSAYFGYSVALGAFIMGSILAETREAHRIETLVTPLKDIFGAVFFVSVGMLLDPAILASNLWPVLLICGVIIIGKVASVSLGALATGQAPSTAVHAGFSMAQIGEFSFIIATLGLTYNAIDPKLYPIIVAASLLTTFTTPYLLKAAPWTTALIERHLPPRARRALERYEAWFRTNAPGSGVSAAMKGRLLRWGANAIMVATVFVVAAEKLTEHIGKPFAALAAFAVASPFIWAMLASFRRQPGLSTALSRLATAIVVGILSIEFFAAWIAVTATLAVAAVVMLTFRQQFESTYRWIERQFLGGIGDTASGHAENHAHLVPWDVRLVEQTVGVGSAADGKTLRDLALRERFGMTIVALQRDSGSLVAPRASERLVAGDVLLCFGGDEHIEAMASEVAAAAHGDRDGDLSAFELRRIELSAASPLTGKTIRTAGIGEDLRCLIVGIERGAQRIQGPSAAEELRGGDGIWVVGKAEGLKKVAAMLGG